METFHGREELVASLGRELGPGEWLEIGQERIDGFADVTGDHQWIHVDAERAATGPYGATVAHGFLTLSLLPLLLDGLRRVEGTRMGLNYGLERVRFPNGGPLRARGCGRARRSWTPPTSATAGCSWSPA